MTGVRRILAGFGVAVAALGVAAGGGIARTSTANNVVSPSGAISCFQLMPKYFKPGIECSAASLPHTQLDGYVELHPHGRATLGERGDYPGIPGPARTLAYGDTWAPGSIRCLMKRAGLRCRNLDGHGFTLSRESYRRF